MTCSNALRRRLLIRQHDDFRARKSELAARLIHDIDLAGIAARRQLR